MKTPSDSCMKKTAQTQKEASGILVYLCEELGDARLRCAQLKKYIKEATDLIEKSEQRDHFFEVAGHLIHGIPDALMRLDNSLDTAAMAAARLDYEEIKNTLRPEKADELENVLGDVRLRYLNRRSNSSKLDKSKVKSWMKQHLHEYLDRKTGEANSTKMAEEACQALNLYDGDNIPEEIFDWSQEVTEAAGHGARLSSSSNASSHIPTENSMNNSKTAAYFLNKIADITEKSGKVPTRALMALIAKLEKQDRTAASLAPKAADAFRNIAKEIGTQKNPSRVKLAGVLRRILADTMEMPSLAGQQDQQQQQAGSEPDYGQGRPMQQQAAPGQQQAAPGQQQAGAGEDFQKANPKITDEEAKAIDEMHDKNKDNFKA